MDTSRNEKYCVKCGTSFPKDANFCPSCGAGVGQGRTSKPVISKETLPVGGQQESADQVSPIPKQALPAPKVISEEAKKRANKANTIACITLLLIFGGCNAIALISTFVEESNLKRSFTQAEFNTTADVMAFINQHEIEYVDNGEYWSSEDEKQSSMVHSLQQAYKECEYKEFAYKVFESLESPGKNVVSYQEELEKYSRQLAGLDGNDEVKGKDPLEIGVAINVELDRIEPLILEAEIIEFLEKDPGGNYDVFLTRLEDYKKRTPNLDLGKQITKAIRKYTPIAKEEKKEREIAELAREKAAAQAEKEREIQRRRNTKLGPKPENSSWDSAVQPVVQYLKQVLKDPKSIEYIEWSGVVDIDLEDEPYWMVRCKFRAKNSFGGYAIEEWLFFIQKGVVVMTEEL